MLRLCHLTLPFATGPDSIQELKVSRDAESADFLPRKKKTPTQLRRERKKRQKERERRQQELERKGRDEVEPKEALATPHDGSSNLHAIDAETGRGKSSNDSSSDSFNHPLQAESSTTSGEQRKKKKKSKTKLSKGLKDDEMVNDSQLTESEYALSSDSENGSESSETQSSLPPSKIANENSAVSCAHVKSEYGSQNKSIEETIICNTDKSESDQQVLVAGTPKDGTTEEHREEPDTSLEPEEVQAKAYVSPCDCSTEQTADGRELQQNITDLTGVAGESTMVDSESTMAASESTMVASESTMVASEDSTAGPRTGGKMDAVDQDSNCSATNEIVVAEQDLPLLSKSSCKDSPAETETPMGTEGSESIQPEDIVSETQEIRSENAALDGENCAERIEGIEVSKDGATPCAIQLAVGTEAVDHPSNRDLMTTLNSSSQEPETVAERVTDEHTTDKMEPDLPSAVKQASSSNNTLTSSSPIPHAGSDCEVTQPEIKDNKTDTEETTQPENQDKTGMKYSKEATQPESSGSDDNDKNPISNQDNSTTRARSSDTFGEMDTREPETSEIETQTTTGDIELESKPNHTELQSSDSDQIRSLNETPETEKKPSTQTKQDKFDSECFQTKHVSETTSMETECKQHEE